MRRLRLVAGWFGLVCAAALLALMFLSVRATAIERERALDSAEAAISDLRDTRQAFRSERAQLHGQVDRLVDEVKSLSRRSEGLRKQVESLRRQVVSLGGEPDVIVESASPPPLAPSTSPPTSSSTNPRSERSPQSTAPEPEPEPESTPTHPGCVNGRGPKECR